MTTGDVQSMQQVVGGVGRVGYMQRKLVHKPMIAVE